MGSTGGAPHHALAVAVSGLVLSLVRILSLTSCSVAFRAFPALSLTAWGRLQSSSFAAGVSVQARSSLRGRLCVRSHFARVPTATQQLYLCVCLCASLAHTAKAGAASGAASSAASSAGVSEKAVRQRYPLPGRRPVEASGFAGGAGTLSYEVGPPSTGPLLASHSGLGTPPPHALVTWRRRGRRGKRKGK